MESKEIKLKELNQEQKDVVKYINKMIIEHQQVFLYQPEELLISSRDFDILNNPHEDIKYLTIRNEKIKIYKV